MSDIEGTARAYYRKSEADHAADAAAKKARGAEAARLKRAAILAKWEPTFGPAIANQRGTSEWQVRVNVGYYDGTTKTRTVTLFVTEMGWAIGTYDDMGTVSLWRRCPVCHGWQEGPSLRMYSTPDQQLFSLGEALDAGFATHTYGCSIWEQAEATRQAEQARIYAEGAAAAAPLPRIMEPYEAALLDAFYGFVQATSHDHEHDHDRVPPHDHET